MCYDDDATPPVASTGTPVTSGPLTLTSADGTRLAAYLAVPERPAGAGVVVIPDNRGLAPFYERLTVRLAEHGHPAIAYDHFGRTAGPSTEGRGGDFPRMEDYAALTRSRQQDDMTAALGRLREFGGTQVALGFCMGGRLAFFASEPRFGLAGVVGFYGHPGIAGPYGPGPAQHAADLSAPVLGLFGGADEGIPESAVKEFGDALTTAGVEHEFVVYPGAPHGFFDVRNDEHADACADAWRRVLAFLDRPGPGRPGPGQVG
ncbi:dienelactone hydrolase family protein [Streptosporangium sandarakinum]|uniref:Carboxymethylenebutenolidase n=1 Tax=Streptosporangium sandarakinum TaxID=1260955 RepID=A0A852USF4_9ACTN|nr:dienelactone hydrolase family protein [Streptosporangium sandarakinum]NYF38538.1 carboxymethylenebutenolidase [Streptosporangium sandarakinum]